MDPERLDNLVLSLSRARRDLAYQDESLQKLKARMTALDLSLSGAAQRLEEMSRQAPPSPPARAPRFWTKLVPIAALAAAGLILAQNARSKPARCIAPAPALATLTLEEAPAIPAEEAAARAIGLTLAYRPEGSRLPVEEILFPELAASSEREGSPWVVTHRQGLTYFVTFRPYGDALENAPFYEFEADLGTGRVTPCAETTLALRPNFAAATTGR